MVEGPLKEIAVSPVFQQSQRIVFATSALVSAMLGLALFSSAGADDSHITNWAAQAIVSHGDYLNYSGDRIEIASSLLHVLTIALLAALSGSDVTNIGGVLGIVFAILAVFHTGRLAGVLEPRTSCFAMGLLSTNLYFTYWSIGGLESTYAAWLAVWLVYRAHLFANAKQLSPVDWLFSAIAIAGVCLIRPEGGIVLLSTLLGMLSLAFGLRREAELVRRSRSLLILGATVVAGLVLLHVGYFGRLFPQPVYAKQTGELIATAAMVRGIAYFESHLFSNVSTALTSAVSAVALLAALVEAARTRTSAFFLLVAIPYCVASLAFVLLSGGDWMEGGRFFVPMTPLIAILVARLVSRAGLAAPAICLALIAVQLVGAYKFSTDGSRGMTFDRGLDFYARTRSLANGAERSWFERTNTVHIRDIPLGFELDHYVQALWSREQRPITIMSRQMGMVLYHVAKQSFGKIDVFDRRGLHDSKLLDCPPSHELPRVRIGLALEYNHFFKNVDAYAACGVPKPDVIFDIGHPHRWLETFDRHGYRLVYYQEPDDETYSAGRDDVRIPWQAFIAIREDLVPDATLKHIRASDLWATGATDDDMKTAESTSREKTSLERVAEAEERDALLALGYLAYDEVEQDDASKSGVTRNAPGVAPGLNLYADRTTGRAHLMDNDGKRIHTWASNVAQPSSEDRFVSSFMFGWQHVEPARDGSLLAIVSRGALLKLDWHSRVEWIAQLPAHHDIAIDPTGKILTLSERPRIVKMQGRPDRLILDNFIAFIDSTGQVEDEISIFELLFAQEKTRALLLRLLDRRFARLEQTSLGSVIEAYGHQSRWTPEEIQYTARVLRNGESPLGARAATALLRRIPGTPSDIFHTNTIEVLSREAPGLWDAGDILISIRNLDLIAVVSPATPKLAWWWGRGELSRQHQPTLLANGNLLIYDNGVAQNRSRILEIDPHSRSIVWESEVDFFSASSGGSEKLSNGNVLVTDSDSGRAFEIDGRGDVVWEYWNPVESEPNAAARRQTIYRMSRLQCDFFSPNQGSEAPVQCAN